MPTATFHDRFNKVKTRFLCARDIRGGEPGSLLAQSVALAQFCVQPVAFVSTVVLDSSALSLADRYRQ